MAIAFRAAATAGARSTTLTIAKPTGTVDGDLMLAVVCARNSNTVTCTPPAGWTLVLEQARSTTGKMFIYRKVASSEGATYDFTLSIAGQANTGAIVSYSGTSLGVDVSASQEGAASTSHVTPSVTTTVADTVVVRFAYFAVGGANPESYTWPSSTERADDDFVDAGLSLTALVGVAGKAQVAAGAAGTETATSSTSSAYAAATVAIKEGAAPPPSGGVWGVAL